jgi:hypothetical protein
VRPSRGEDLRERSAAEEIQRVGAVVDEEQALAAGRRCHTEQIAGPVRNESDGGHRPAGREDLDRIAVVAIDGDQVTGPGTVRPSGPLSDPFLVRTPDPGLIGDVLVVASGTAEMLSWMVEAK